jgi:hypothetical protein
MAKWIAARYTLRRSPSSPPPTEASSKASIIAANGVKFSDDMVGKCEVPDKSFPSLYGVRSLGWRGRTKRWRGSRVAGQWRAISERMVGFRPRFWLRYVRPLADCGGVNGYGHSRDFRSLICFEAMSKVWKTGYCYSQQHAFEEGSCPSRARYCSNASIWLHKHL